MTATDFIQPVEQPGLGPARLARSPIDLGTSPSAPRPAPLLGQHTREVLAAAGFGEETITELLGAGVLGEGRHP